MDNSEPPPDLEPQQPSLKPDGAPLREVHLQAHVQGDEELKLSLQAAQACIWSWNLQTNEISGASEIWKLLGRIPNPAESGSHALFDTVHPKDLPALRASIERHLSQRSDSFACEFRASTVDNTWLWLNCAGRITQRDPDGRPLRISGVMMNVDQQHAAAQLPADSQARFEEMADSAPVLLWLAAADKDCSFFNHAWLRFTGRTIEQERGTGWIAGVHPEDTSRCLTAYNTAFAAREQFESEYRLRRHDGQYRWILDRGVPRFAESGAFLGYLGCCVDVNAHRLAEQAATERLDRLEESERMARLGHWSWTRSPEQIIWSRGVFQLFEIDPARGVPDFAGMLATYDSPSAQRLELAISDGVHRAMPYDLTLRRSTAKESWVHVTGNPRLGTAGNVVGLFGTVMDATDRVISERRLIDALAAAQTASRSKSEFLANMSHEIRTPLTAIMGYADVLRDEGDLSQAPRPRLEAVETILRNGEHLLTVINDILDLSKIEAGRLTCERISVSPAQIVEEVVSLLRVRAAGKGLALLSRYDTPVPLRAVTDPVRLRQILMNLVGNAVKFTESGSVSIVVSMHGAADTLSLHFAVIDTGIGMDAAYLSRLFEAFSQADSSTTRRFGGTGLGLRISLRLAEMLGGTITATSTAGAGSAFVLRIPLDAASPSQLHQPGIEASADADQPARIPRSSSAQAGKTAPILTLEGVRILLAEDGTDNQRLICHHLRRCGAEVTVVENGKLAVEALTEGGQFDRTPLRPAPFDIVLMDMQMPVMDGYSAAESLKSIGSTVPIIALTAHAMGGEREKCIAAGCDDYATKPIDKDDLIARCRAWASHPQAKYSL